ncbi:two-partner secretion domain-containing protein [Diaphorobacter aerolatus]|uniref:Filamentous hemagglutinin N-terminal domain-containing protein n=1 Tax=Diaphorobacter aerolatus TaxID=1288495 RepID=A0A7H0GLK6_9BURK|nr:filamentous hemagglutinin N-terminal domain-containing protein [Diaphorobacter aerolatus]QNP49172.1 filamentous hemagglutinin N-terminal domain-containing protein [Diaphorobacter aerolatus]
MKKAHASLTCRAPRTALGPLRPLVVALMSAGAAAALAQTLPVGENVIAGNASVSRPSANVLNVNQTSDRSVIHWSTFSVVEGATVNFQQPGTGSITLNRVVGTSSFGGASVVNGNINAPGRVFIINPLGVLFGRTAQVNVGGLVASSLDLAQTTGTDRNAAFMAGGENFVFERTAPSVDASASIGRGREFVVNTGNLTATGSGGRGGLIALIAPYVVNTGTIKADGGTVALGAGGRVTLDVGGDGLTKLTVGQDSSLISTGVENRQGKISANGGRIVLDSTQGQGEAGGVIVHDGSELTANTMYNRNGEIVLASEGRVHVSRSTLQARGDAPGTTGGSIQLRGADVRVSSGSLEGLVDSSWEIPFVDSTPIKPLMDVSGQSGGGSISMTSQPRTGVRSIDLLVLDETTTLRADALGTGNGGKVTLAAPSALVAYGRVSARGGANGGDGGLVETSAVAQGTGFQVSGNLYLEGIDVDAGTTSGRAGTWLINGNGLSVVHGSTQGTAASTLVAGGQIQDGDINFALNHGTNVGISTASHGRDRGNLTLAGDAVIDRTQTSNPVALTFSADGDIASQGPTVIRSASGPLQVAMNAGVHGGEHSIDFSGSVLTRAGR